MIVNCLIEKSIFFLVVFYVNLIFIFIYEISLIFEVWSFAITYLCKRFLTWNNFVSFFVKCKFCILTISHNSILNILISNNFLNFIFLPNVVVKASIEYIFFIDSVFQFEKITENKTAISVFGILRVATLYYIYLVKQTNFKFMYLYVICSILYNQKCFSWFILFFTDNLF